MLTIGLKGIAGPKPRLKFQVVADASRRPARCAPQHEPEQAKPSIFYARKSAQVDGDHARLAYDVTIRQGRDETHRNALISAERVGEKWTVGNFIVGEGWLPTRPAAP